MNPGEWIAFAALLITVVAGGMSAAVWIIMAINKVDKRLTVLETTIRLILPEAGAWKLEPGGRLRRV